MALSGINYEKIRGTYTVKPVHFACSDALPCLDVSLTTIELKPLQEHYHMYDPFCWQTFGELNTPTTPPIDCLQIGKPSSNRPQSDHDACWASHFHPLYYGVLTCVVGMISQPLSHHCLLGKGYIYNLGSPILKEFFFSRITLNTIVWVYRQYYELESDSRVLGSLVSHNGLFSCERVY